MLNCVLYTIFFFLLAHIILLPIQAAEMDAESTFFFPEQGSCLAQLPGEHFSSYNKKLMSQFYYFLEKRGPDLSSLKRLIIAVP